VSPPLARKAIRALEIRVGDMRGERRCEGVYRKPRLVLVECRAVQAGHGALGVSDDLRLSVLNGCIRCTGVRHCSRVGMD
jgi:hypothetical protein